MTEQVAAAAVQRIISELFTIPIDQVTLESSPQSIEAWDSVGQLNLIIALEQEFHVQFSVDDIGKMVDVQGIVRVLGGHGIA